MTNPIVLRRAVEELLKAESGDAFALLGPHVAGGIAVVRAFLPGANEVELCNQGGVALATLEQTHDDGLFEGSVAESLVSEGYRFRVAYDEKEIEIEDPYSFPSLLDDDDVRLFFEGRHEHAWRFLGAHSAVNQGIVGVQFAVWAPNARRVAVLGDFNHYDARTHCLRFHPSCGIWEMFVPAVKVGARYRFEILGADDTRVQKADPYARAMLEPSDSIAVVTENRFQWNDSAWLGARENGDLSEQPMSVYEVHAASWRPGLGYRTLAHELLDYVVDMGFTHVQFMPLTEYPFSGSWGYQPIGMYAPTGRFGTPDELRYFINAAHERGIGVLLDWVPAHFPDDSHGLGRFDGTALYEHEDPRQGRHPDWGTLIFNYGREGVLNFLVSNALYWIEEFHVDGLRVDAVASMLYLDYSRNDGEWIPNEHGSHENLQAMEFLRRANQAVLSRHPGTVMIAEESTAWPRVTGAVEDGGLGFSYKWNMGWMHDGLRYVSKDPVYRKDHHEEITFSLVYAWSERYVLPISHDEVVYGKGSLLGKMPGDSWQRFANLRLWLAYMWAHPGKKHLFMGCEFGQPSEWNHEGSVDWGRLQERDHNGVQRLVRELNRLYASYPQLYASDCLPTGFQWLVVDDAAQSVIAFARLADGTAPLVVVINMTPVVRRDYPLDVLDGGRYLELLNTDDRCYGGMGLGNSTVISTDFANRLMLTLPPLAALILVRE